MAEYKNDSASFPVKTGVRRYTVSTDDLIHNIGCIQELAGTTPVWAVLKGNGYGLGLDNMAKIMYQQGIRRFCVTELEEAQRLDALGYPDIRILTLQPTTDKDMIKNLLSIHVIFTVSGYQDAAAIYEAAQDLGTCAEVHLKIDTGMGRYGFLPQELDDILNVYKLQENLKVSGIYTHFSSAAFSEKRTLKQHALFTATIEAIKKAGFDPGEAHCCNSSAAFKWPQLHMDGIRIGSAWLGRSPLWQSRGLRSIGKCESRVEEIHQIPKGHRTGYCGSWKAKRQTTLAIIPVGWYHGYSVEYNKDTFRIRDFVRGSASLARSVVTHKRLWVQINGHNYPVCGHVGMIYIAADVTDLPCNVGDPVTLNISPLLQNGMETYFL